MLAIRVGNLSVPLHTIFELLAYAVGFRLFLILRKKLGDPLPSFERLCVLAAAVAGAGLGSKLMVWLQHPGLLHESGWRALLLGKSVAGALLGGLILVEAVKRWIDVRRPTGDLYVLPLCAGIALGRVGCFLNGLADGTPMERRRRCPGASISGTGSGVTPFSSTRSSSWPRSGCGPSGSSAPA